MSGSGADALSLEPPLQTGFERAEELSGVAQTEYARGSAPRSFGALEESFGQSQAEFAKAPLKSDAFRTDSGGFGAPQNAPKQGGVGESRESVSPLNAAYFERVPTVPSRPLKNQILAQNPPIDELVAQNAHVSREDPQKAKKTLFHPKHYNFGDSLFESSSDSERARSDPREIDLDDDEVLLRAKISAQRARDAREQSAQVSDNLRRQLEETERLLRELTSGDAGRFGPKTDENGERDEQNEKVAKTGEREAISPENGQKSEKI